jgi:hypothetical protein
MRRLISSKSKTYTEVSGVYGAVINVEVGAHYPGRSPLLPQSATATERWWDGDGEVSRGHSRWLDPTEGPNMEGKKGAPSFR